MIIEFKKSFLNDLKKIKEKNLKRQIFTIIKQIEVANSLLEIKNIAKLTGYENFYRIKIKNYRIGFYYQNNKIIFVRILHRKDIYKYFP